MGGGWVDSGGDVSAGVAVFSGNGGWRVGINEAYCVVTDAGNSTYKKIRNILDTTGEGRKIAVLFDLSRGSSGLRSKNLSGSGERC